MTKRTYDKIESFFKRHRFWYKLLKFAYTYIPLLIFFSYPIVLVWQLIQTGITSRTFLKILIVPAVIFAFVTVFRKAVNFKRPYEKLDINPLIKKDKQGQSFPSRHSASIFIITMSFIYINVYLGIAAMILGIILCITRVLGGVHYIRDVMAGALFSIIVGYFLIFLI